MLKRDVFSNHFKLYCLLACFILLGHAMSGCTAPATTLPETADTAASSTSNRETSDTSFQTSRETTVPTTRPTTTQTEATTVDPFNAVVGLAQGDDYAEVTAEAIARAGGLSEIVHAGDTVLIKPNLCWNNYVDSPITTDYRVVAEIVREVQALEAGEILVAEGPFGPECFTSANLAKSRYDTISGVEFVSFNKFSKDDCYYLQGENSVTGEALYIPKIYVDADVVITVPKMKTHNAGMVTLGLKNAFGVPPRGIYGTKGSTEGSKILLHQDFDFNEAIVEINLIRKPDFVVIDGIIAGEGEGPLKNTAVDARIVLAGRDIVAVDTVGAILMGFNPVKIPHLSQACEAGLGEGNIEKIKVVGGVLSELIMDFKSIFPKD